jgi:L-fuculose-phosphate aldolase
VTSSNVPYPRERREVARFMRRLCRQGLTTTSGGNISWRVAPEFILLTPSKLDKGCLTGEQVAVMRTDGTNLTPGLVPSIETPVHLGLYRALPHVHAVVHAHPPTGSAFCASRTPINCRLSSESYAILGQPVLAPYACMGTAELAARVLEAARRSNCVLMENHGVLTTGESLLQAFDRLEVLEAAARLTLLTRLLGEARELSAPHLAELDRVLGRLPSP